jgi:hypothetical protein
MEIILKFSPNCKEISEQEGRRYNTGILYPPRSCGGFFEVIEDGKEYTA